VAVDDDADDEGAKDAMGLAAGDDAGVAGQADAGSEPDHGDAAGAGREFVRPSAAGRPLMMLARARPRCSGSWSSCRPGRSGLFPPITVLPPADESAEGRRLASALPRKASFGNGGPGLRYGPSADMSPADRSSAEKGGSRLPLPGPQAGRGLAFGAPMDGGFMAIGGSWWGGVLRLERSPNASWKDGSEACAAGGLSGSVRLGSRRYHCTYRSSSVPLSMAE
jgi:hypothetical protein